MTYAKYVATEYMRLRKKHPWLPSKQAILWARGNVKPLEFEWEPFTGNHLAVGTGTRDGFDIRITVDQSDEVSDAVTVTDTDTGIRNPNFDWQTDGWRREGRFIALESDSTVQDLAKEYRKYGDARNVAWERAHEALQDEAESYINGDTVPVYFTATASVKGMELGTGSIGSELALTYGVEMERECDNTVQETDIVEQAIEEARENAAELREALAAV